MELENIRLKILLRQFPEAGWMNGSIVFCAEKSEPKISQISPVFEHNYLTWATESGFQSQLIDVLNWFIEYREDNGITPGKEGIVRLGSGIITIEWLEYGSTHLTNPELQIQPDTFAGGS